MEKAPDRVMLIPFRPGAHQLTLVLQRQTDCSAPFEEKEERYPDPWPGRSFERNLARL